MKVSPKHPIQDLVSKRGAVSGFHVEHILSHNDENSELFGGDEEHAGEDSVHDEMLEDLVFYDLPELLVNLNSTDRKSNYLKIRVALEISDPDMIALLDARLPRIMDKFQVYLRELRLDDLRGSAGMFRIKEELLARVNKAVYPVRINDVLFKEMLVQ